MNRRIRRWYDKYILLAKYLDSLKNLDFKKRDKLIRGVMYRIKDSNPQLLQKFVLDFPLTIKRQRWYDTDPYLWLIVNGLKYADHKLIKQVIAYLAKHIELKCGNN